MKKARNELKKSGVFLKRRIAEHQPDEAREHNSVLGLQRSVGNRAVAGLLQSDGDSETTRPVLSGAAPQIQRAPNNGAPAPVTEPASAAGPLIVEDDAATVAPGQMRKSEFLEQLRRSVCATADEAMKEAGESTKGCPYLEQWLGYYADREPAHIERALRKYAPEAATATSAREYIPAVSNRVRRGVETWAKTGELTGVPDELKGMLTGPGAALGAIGGVLGSIGSAIGGAVSAAVGAIGGAFSSIGKALFKRKEGTDKETADPEAIQSQLSGGQPLDGEAKSRMGAAFGHDFSGVRVHTGAEAAGLSDDLNARAFTVGSDIAFGPGEYQPGTMIGDALIAHELAHVVQQSGGKGVSSPQSKTDHGHDGLEEEADVAAAGAVSSLWLDAKGAVTDIGRNALPRMKSGLKLQSCQKHTVTNRGTIVKTRHSGHERMVQGPSGEIRIVNAPDMTKKEVNEELTRLGLLSKVTELAPPTNDYSCHGYTFLGGKSWIDNDQVPTILADNGYVPTTTPAVGDIVIYKAGQEYKHSGIITEVKGTTVTKITSKWGLWGLYSHDPNDVPGNYGTWTAYHTDRPGGHQLRREK